MRSSLPPLWCVCASSIVQLRREQRLKDRFAVEAANHGPSQLKRFILKTP
jgi:hypothetical protein